MKTNSVVMIQREGKSILIYVNDGDWSKIPDLSFIADVEVHLDKPLDLKDQI
jgi:hypothetical protein